MENENKTLPKSRIEQVPATRKRAEVTVDTEKTNLTKPIDMLLADFGTYSEKQRQVAFLQLLSQQPPKAWVKNTDPNNPDNKYMKDSKGQLVPYMDVQRMWWIMDTLLLNPRLEILGFDTQQITRAEHFYTDQSGIQHREVDSKEYVICTVRLHYYNHGIGKDTYVDGVATAEVGQGNQKIELVHAKARSEAFKNAAKSIGNLLGRSLEREELVITQETSPWTRESAKNKLMDGLLNENQKDR
jgi:hypothetical protein